MDRQRLSLPRVRDHVLHNELMIGCLWAGRTDCGIDIVDLMRRYFTQGPTAKYGHDQRMLGRMLWPLIRGRCLVHDKYYRLAGVHEVDCPIRKAISAPDIRISPPCLPRWRNSASHVFFKHRPTTRRVARSHGPTYTVQVFDLTSAF